ncbi:MAG TPA: nuclear transport factor 2 family protein [Gemmatimonadaceae bacterium]|nr:nuclear transport factor 2 family protein [Gemmatimonadaceae bacterium]
MPRPVPTLIAACSLAACSLAACALAACALAACAHHVSVRADVSSDEAAVRQLEERVAAATGANDPDALEPLLAADFTFVNPVGLLITKQQFLDNFRTGRLQNSKYDVSEMAVRMYGDAAVVTYRSDVAGPAGSQQISNKRRRTTMLVKRDGRWLIVAQQSTPILDMRR